MSDAILIGSLAVKAVIGVYGWEQQVPRPLLLDLELHLDLRPAGRSDALADTVDYQAVADLASAIATEQRYALIEHFADVLARRLLAAFSIQQLRLTVHKPGAVAAARTLSVRIERSPDDYSA